MITMLLQDPKTTLLNQTKKYFDASLHPLPENLEPSNIRQAMQHTHWRQAISEEFNALIRNGTWSLVPLETSHI
jgi:hypothetical protein